MELPFRKWTGQDGVLLVGLGLLVVGLGLGLNKPKVNNFKTEIVRLSPTMGAKIEEEIWAQIGGEVIHPGVYKFKGQARINDLLVAAGGLGAKADREWVELNINRAARLTDGDKIVVPRVGEELRVNVAVLGSQGQEKININQADVTDLDKLSGVGPVIGQRIIDYRKNNGSFKSLEEIKLVEGIGEALWNKIKDQISL